MPLIEPKAPTFVIERELQLALGEAFNQGIAKAQALARTKMLTAFVVDLNQLFITDNGKRL